MLSEKNTAKLIRIFKKYIPTIQGLYLFGSQARGDAMPESDADFGFLSENPVSGETAFQLKVELVNALGKDVDIVDMRRADSVTNVQIIGTGKQVFALDQHLIDQYEMIAFSQYALLNEERREIIEDISKRGTVVD